MSGPSPASLIGDWNKARGRSLNPEIGTGSYTGPMDYKTGFSTVSNGVTTIDPAIRALRESSLADYMSSTGDIRNRFLGNESSYVQSLLNPLRESLASRRGELQRSVGLRGMGGSSFGEQSLTNLDVTGQRELRDANAQAQQQALSALMGVDQSRLAAQNSVAEQNLAQELSALGLSRDQINAMIGNFQNQQARELTGQAMLNKMLVDIDTSAQNWFKSSMGAGAAMNKDSSPSAGKQKTSNTSTGDSGGSNDWMQWLNQIMGSTG